MLVCAVRLYMTSCIPSQEIVLLCRHLVICMTSRDVTCINVITCVLNLIRFFGSRFLSLYFVNVQTITYRGRGFRIFSYSTISLRVLYSIFWNIPYFIFEISPLTPSYSVTARELCCIFLLRRVKIILFYLHF